MLFVFCFLLRTLLNCLVISAPVVRIDESLYTNIARSLAAGEGVLYRSQPIDYPYLAYPVLLVPVYALHRILGGDLYRFVQIFNTLLITSSVFPAYLLARRFSKNDRIAFALSFIVAMMPDMIMGGYEMSESLIWPLAMWLFYFGFRSIEEDTVGFGLAAAAISALMYATKPGAVVMGAVILLVRMIVSMKRRQGIMRAVVPVLSLLVLVAICAFVGKQLTPVSDSAIGLYKKQLTEWKAGDILVAGAGTVLTVFLFSVACGVVYALLPLFSLKHYDSSQRSFVIAFYIGLLALIIGTAVFIVPYKWDGGMNKIPLHLRYCSYCIPVCYMFSAEQSIQKVNRKALAVLLTVFLILTVFPSPSVGFIKGFSTRIDSVSVAAYNNETSGVLGLLATIMLVFFIVSLILTLISSKVNPKSFLKYCFVFLSVFLLYNNVCAYVNADAHASSAMCEDAVELDKMIGRKQCLGITQQMYDDIYSYGMESRINAPMHQVTSNQFYVEILQTKGVYVPFVPIDQSPNINCHATPETEYFVLGQTIAEHIELNPSVKIRKTKNGLYTFAQIVPGERMVDSMLHGLDRNTLPKGKKGLLSVFDETRIHDGSISVQIQASGNGRLKIADEIIQLSENPATYTVTVPYALSIPVTALDGDVQIITYTTEQG